jgi:hypothetical protein
MAGDGRMLWSKGSLDDLKELLVSISEQKIKEGHGLGNPQLTAHEESYLKKNGFEKKHDGGYYIDDGQTKLHHQRRVSRLGQKVEGGFQDC